MTRHEIPLSETLYTVRDLQGTGGQASKAELRDLGDAARELERQAAAAPDLLAAVALRVALEDADADPADTRWKRVRGMERTAIAKACPEGRGGDE
jgi:hypothetical protein